MNCSDPAMIEMIIFDVDGVLTDGTININDDGSETKRFSVRDGFGIRLWLDAGFKIAIITGRSGEALKHRLASLQIDPELVIQGSRDKSEALDVILEKTGIDPGKIAYLGDDWPDLVAMERVGLPMAVGDAEPEVIEAAAFVTSRNGGRGAARDAIAHLLKAKGLYTEESLRCHPLTRRTKEVLDSKSAIISALEQAHISIHRHADIVELSNTYECTFRSLFLEHLYKDNPGVRCQSEWNHVDLLIRFAECNVLIEFKYYLHKQNVNLDGSKGIRKGGAKAQNKKEFDDCVQQLYQDSSSPIHEKYIILVYEANAPSSRAGSYSDFYDQIDLSEMVRSVDRFDTGQNDPLRTVLITIK